MSRAQPSPEAVFDQVVELPPTERDARLTDLCGADTDLRTEVESLLRAWDASGDFLAAPADISGPLDALSGPARRDRRGETIGPWHLETHLGSGGMGEVWLATRMIEGARQQVALKIIHAAVLAADGLSRFRNECRVLARLDHPGIARLIEGAVTPEGEPYLVVEYVAGRPLDVWCDENGLEVAERMRLLMQVCEAVRHLHRHSVIHRDIKPGNILVGRDGRPRLIDFGISRVLDDAAGASELTLTGLERMTIPYASPEQLRGEPLSIASDVYSLGVVAFRLLTGKMPRADLGRWDLAQDITTSPPPRPSESSEGLAGTMPGAIRGDLDTIVQTALHADLDRRYPSAEALREDLDRHLEGRPVLARGDSLSYVAGKFIRRHAPAVVLAVTALVVLVGGVISGFTLYGSAETARREAELQRETALEVSGFLEGLLAAGDPVTGGAGVGLTVREVLDTAADRLARDLGTRPEVAATLHATIGSAYLNLDLLDEAEAHYLAADSLYASGAARDPLGPERVLVRRGELAFKRENYAVAESLLTRVTAGASGPARALAWLNLSRMYGDQSRLDQAMEAADRATELALHDPGQEQVLPTQTMSQKGVLLYRLGRYAAAESAMVAAVARARADLGEDHVLVGECTQNLGVIRTALDRNADAIAAFSAALDVYGDVYPPGHTEFGTTLLNRGDALARLGRDSEALEDYQRAREIFAAAPGNHRMSWSLATNGIAHCRWRNGELAAADSLFGEAMGAMAEIMGTTHPWTALTRCNRARVWVERGWVAAGAEAAATALTDLEAALPVGHVYLVRPLLVLVEADLARGRLETAASGLRRLQELTADEAPAGLNRVSLGLQMAAWHRARGEAEPARALLDSLAALAAGTGEDGRLLRRKIAEARGTLDN